LPILDGNMDVATATKQLVELGNNLNGHDNITVALVHCQVKVQEPETPLGYSQSLDKTSNGAVSSSSFAVTLSEPPTADAIEHYVPIANTQLLSPLPPPQQSRSWLLPIVLGIGLLLSAAAGLWLAYNHNWQERNPAANSDSNDTTNVARSPERVYEAQQETPLQRQAGATNSSPEPPQLNAPDFTLPQGSIVKVLNESKLPSQQRETWTQLQVCSNPEFSRTSTSSTGDRRILKPGDNAWIANTELDRRFKEFSGGNNPCSTSQALPTQTDGGNQESGGQGNR
jgi:protein phosphatase